MLNLLTIYIADIVLEVQTQILNIQHSHIQDTRSAVCETYFNIFAVMCHHHHHHHDVLAMALLNRSSAAPYKDKRKHIVVHKTLHIGLLLIMTSVIFVNENENCQKRKNNELVNEN